MPGIRAFCAESLGDITETMRDKGQQFPAIGQRTEQGIVVFDGSRRRPLVC